MKIKNKKIARKPKPVKSEEEQVIEEAATLLDKNLVNALVKVLGFEIEWRN